MGRTGRSRSSEGVHLCYLSTKLTYGRSHWSGSKPFWVSQRCRGTVHACQLQDMHHDVGGWDETDWKRTRACSQKGPLLLKERKEGGRYQEGVWYVCLQYIDLSQEVSVFFQSLGELNLVIKSPAMREPLCRFFFIIIILDTRLRWDMFCTPL